MNHLIQEQYERDLRAAEDAEIRYPPRQRPRISREADLWFEDAFVTMAEREAMMRQDGPCTNEVAYNIEAATSELDRLWAQTDA